MKTNSNVKSIEPNIADLANGWLKSYKLDYKLEQNPLAEDIDKALDTYFSKNGGSGGNRPDAKLLLSDKYGNRYPILIEYKGYKDRLIKTTPDGQIDNKNDKNEYNFKNINSYAVNGAVHYANAVLHHTNYTDVIAIGMTGDMNEYGKIEHEIGVYYVSKRNFGMGQKVDDYTDLSFLKKENFDAFIEKVKALIARFGGNVTNVDEWGKRKLAYEIQKMKEGFYYFITFESDSNCPNEVEQRVRIMEDVIRYLCIRQDA